jgi:hypothetical protein
MAKPHLELVIPANKTVQSRVAHRPNGGGTQRYGYENTSRVPKSIGSSRLPARTGTDTAIRR